jgi:two-component system sensor histidine kinase/response regulator
MTIARSLFILAAVPLLALLALGLFGGQQLSTVEQRSRFVAESRIVALATIGNLSRSFEGLRVEVRSYLLATNPEQRSAARRRFDQNEQEVVSLLQRYKDQLVFSDEGRRLLSEFQSLSQEWLANAREVMLLADEGRHEEGVASLNSTLTEVGERLAIVSRAWIQNNEQLAAMAGSDVVNAIATFRSRMILAIVAAALLMGTLGYVTYARIVQPIRELESSVKTIAAGDYEKSVPFTQAVDETGGLARSVHLLKQGAARTHELLEQTQKQDAELQRINFMAGSALDLTKAGYWHVPLDNSGWYNSSERAVKIYGDLPNPGLRYRLEDWARHVEEGDAAAAQPAFENFQAAIAGKAPLYDAVYAYKRPVDGRVVWIHALGHVVKDLDGQPVDMYGVAQDITDFKLAELAIKEREQRIRETEQFYRSVLELAPDGLMVVDAKGIIKIANLQCEKYFGYSREELIGQCVEMLVPVDVRAGHVALREAFHETSTARAMGTDRELRGQRKDGSLFPIEVGLSPLPARDSQDRQVAVSIRDVTDHKRQEREIIAARQKAEEATQMKSLFLANMSHEIRTPMNAIIGLSHLALKTPMNAKQRDYVSKIHNAGTSLLGIINDILDVSKIEAGKLDIEITDFKLDDVIGSVTTLTGHKANEKGIEFLAHISPGIPQFLRGDPLRLAQILTNLINNAIKFTERGEVRVTAQQIQQTGEKCQLKFSVRDTGMGISKEQAERLFQPFMQADMSTTRVHGGTGLGLTICKRLVELMGGQIWMESEPGVGSTFTFTVWLGIGEQKGSGKVVPEKVTRLRTLIVDDNAAAREILGDLLNGVVLHTNAVSSAAEAISDIQQNAQDAPYDVVFMDWRMPNMDGLEASRLIKADTSLKNAPAIIMVTAFGLEEVREEAERMGLDGFLIKPVTKSMIIDALINVFAEPADQKAALSMAASEGLSLAGMRVLLVEDNDINQQIAVELLEGAGARVEIAGNGRESVDKLFNGPNPAPFDVVLMDLQMPVMDGHQATAKIRSEPRFATLPIVAMTAHATFEERRRCLAAGMNEHIAKPIDPGLLFETLARFLKMPGGSAAPVTPGPEEMLKVDGLDVKDGLTRVGGNKPLYLKLLRQFADQYADAGAQIAEHLANGDSSTAQRLAHTLKGLAGSLGARSLQDEAGAIEKRLRDQASADAIEPLILNLRTTLEPIAAQLKAALSSSGASEAQQVPPAANVDPARTRAAAELLTKLFDDFDASAVDFIEANEADLRGAFDDPAAWDRFLRQARGFAFADAHATLKAALVARGF